MSVWKMGEFVCLNGVHPNLFCALPSKTPSTSLHTFARRFFIFFIAKQQQQQKKKKAKGEETKSKASLCWRHACKRDRSTTREEKDNLFVAMEHIDVLSVFLSCPIKK